MKTETKKLIGIAALTLFIGLLLGGLFFGGSKNSNTDEHLHNGEMVKGTIWTCSMHPQIRQGEPGNCPLCGMELIPLADDTDADLDPAAISMSQTAMQIANVSTEIVGTSKPVKLLRMNGKVQADERLVYSQSSHVPGRIERLSVNFTGEYVNNGQILATIYSPELVNAQEELFEARKIADIQPLFFNSSKEKLKNWKLSDKQIAQILESGKIREELPILADISGYVTEKKVNLGDYVNKGQVIYQIANLNSVWILFDVYESDMALIKKGDKVRFSLQSLPGEEFLGKISYIDPVIDPMSRVAKARVEVSNKDLKLKPEMFVSGTVEAKLPIKSDAIVVPKSAVMWTGERSVVYVKNPLSKEVSFVMRNVTLGPALGNGFVINEGLAAGEEIAVNGTFSIDAAAQLAGKPSMMNPEGGPAMTGHNHGSTSTSSSMDPSTKTGDKSLVVDQKTKDALIPIYTEYLSMKDALVNDELASAKLYATKLITAVKKVNMSLFKGDSHEIWMTQSGDIKNALQHAEHFNTLDEIRKAFQTISDRMIALEKAFKSNSETLFVLHCPMANNNMGADWISATKEIKNPYYGQAMLTCGKVTEELK